MNFPKEVVIIEVGPRDGLQNEPQFVDTEIKKAFIQKLAAAGIKEMELTSFVSAKWVPQMKDAGEIVQSAPEGVRGIVLAPNRKGIERVLKTSCKSVAVFVGVSNTFNKKNINKSTRESMAELQPLIEELKAKTSLSEHVFPHLFIARMKERFKKTTHLHFAGNSLQPELMN